MTNKVENLTDADLDQATGGTDRNHTDWIPVLSVDHGTTRGKSGKSVNKAAAVWGRVAND